MNNKQFDELIESIQNDQPDPKAASEAAERVRHKLFGVAGVAQVAGRIQSCDDYRGLIPAYLQRTLSDSRRMLLDDHIRECVPCRKALDEARSGKPKGAVRVIPSSTGRPSTEYRKWAIAAALLVTAGVGSWYTLRTGGMSGEPVATVDSVDGVLYQVSDHGILPVGGGRQLAAGDELRAGRGTHAVVRLFDGTLIEMNERADLSVDRPWRGTTIRLEQGNIIVQAAKQKHGKLFVTSGDSTISVKGTIFDVNHGTLGTRVSVVEGAVQVDHASKSVLLKPGGQTTSDPNLSPVPVKDEIAWSHDSARYLALLGELSDLQTKISAIPSPALRYQSNLLRYIPADTMIYAAIPNAGEQLREARQMFEEQARTNPALREWWQSQQRSSQKMLAGLDRLQTLSTFIGTEAVLVVRPNHQFAVLAEAKSPGLDAFLQSELQNAKGVAWKIHANTLILASDPSALEALAANVDAGGTPTTPFRDRISQSYTSGAGWLLCLNAKQFQHASDSAASLDLGVDNINDVVFERREVMNRTETTAAIDFGTQRSGVASWLGAPGPLSTLDFVSPDAGAALAFVMKNPREVVEEALAGLRKRNPNVDQQLALIESTLGVKLVDDIAGPLGSEVTIAQDGPLLPDLSWKVAIEVNAPQTLQHTIETLVAAVPKQTDAGSPAPTLTLTSSVDGGLTYYHLSGSAFPMTIHYTYSDGYLIAAPSQSMIASAIDNRRRGNTLARSEKFRAQLPTGASPNFSALVYHNISQVTAPVAEQLQKLNVMTEEQRRSAAKLSNMPPALIYVYGEPNRISISSTGGFLGMNLGMLSGLDRGLPFLIPQGLIPKSTQ
ncbi:MAG TPA: FecR domain-containing protein [Bryobacteraceae bacterium]|jgi:hypothetical protein